jgi:hypothetical protein
MLGSLPGLIGLFTTTSVSKKPYVFITGVPRSGTTLIKKIITLHPKYGGCSYESTSILHPPRKIKKWSREEVSNQEFQKLLSSSNNIVSLYDSVCDRILKEVGGKIFVDKIWPSRIRFSYILRRFPNARWIHILRDPRDGYCSANRHRDIPQSSDPKKWLGYWKRSVKLCESIPAGRRFTVRYETLVKYPDSATKHIMSFLESEYHSRQTEVESKSEKMSTYREHRKLDEPINPHSVGKWRDELDEGEKKVFDSVKYAGTYWGK